MKTGKNIDNIFRDRVMGAKMEPPQDVWENIVLHLPEEGAKRNFFPLWLKAAGAAALIALLLSIYDLAEYAVPKAGGTVTLSGKSSLYDPEMSADFERIMKESAILLEALALVSDEMKLQHKPAKAAAAEHRSPAESITAPFKELANLQKITSLEYREDQVFPEKDLQLEERTELVGIAELSNLQKDGAGVDSETNLSPTEIRAGGKFRLSSRVAPIYFNSMGGGNAVDDSFSQKEAAGEVTFSYGAGIAYEISPKVNIRTGFQKVDLAYDTREVSFNDVAATKSFGAQLQQSAMLVSPAAGILKQRMDFLEVPVEVEYMILDKKIAVGLIGGGSALFLEDSKSTLETFGSETELGENNIAKKVSFTTNFGLSLGYDLTKQLQFGIEPVIKLQMNTFENSGNSNPYFLGIYSGINYRF